MKSFVIDWARPAPAAFWLGFAFCAFLGGGGGLLLARTTMAESAAGEARIVTANQVTVMHRGKPLMLSSTKARAAERARDVSPGGPQSAAPETIVSLRAASHQPLQDAIEAGDRSDGGEALITAPAQEPVEDAGPPPAARLAIVIDDLGPDVAAARAFLAFPEPLTLAFLPFAAATPRLADEAAETRTVLIHMPSEPTGLEDPGPGALTVDLTPEEIAVRVAAARARVPGAVGLNNHMGSRFTADAAGVRALAFAVGEHELFLLDSLTTPDSLAYDAAVAAGVPALKRDVFIDNVRNVTAIEARLDEAAALAFKTGRAIAIGHPYPETLEALRLWRARKPKDLAVTPLDRFFAPVDADAPAIEDRPAPVEWDPGVSLPPGPRAPPR